ncbi:MAG TPA: TonB-dependent receptor [Opitutaceae bacterium]|nr:TonB-dependent receptor [Opitutaceae bacterium]
MNAAAPRRRSRRLLQCALLIAAAPLLRGQSTGASSLADLSIEQLMNEPVTSVAKKETNLFESPAAVAVITADDMRRLGATDVPEALRYAPGLDVARIGASEWAVSSRGSNAQFANDLLVLVDGRTVYTPSFGGVLWAAQEPASQEIERIEIVRGPGSTLWGANAVNGVVNIITKSARATQGWLVSAGEGLGEERDLTVRYGGQAGPSVAYRAYVEAANRPSLPELAGGDSGDGGRSLRTGFRLDAGPADNTLMVEGSYYDVVKSEPVQVPLLAPPYNAEPLVGQSDRGVSLTARWSRDLSDVSQWSLQSFYSREANVIAVTPEYDSTYDLEFQDRLAPGAGQDLVWGAGFRYVSDDLLDSALARWDANRWDQRLLTAFAQDQIALLADRLSLIAGSKVEHNDFTGMEWEPGGRLLWTPDSSQTAWLAVSRAVRTPSGVETNGRLNVATVPDPAGGPPAEIALQGRPGLGAEDVIAYELGYRVRPRPNLSLDLAAFYNRYTRLIEYGEPVALLVPAPVPHLDLVAVEGDAERAEEEGAEAALEWRVSPAWRLSASYSLLSATFRPDGDEAGNSPRHQAHLRSFWDLGSRLELNAGASYISAVSYNEGSAPLAIPGYFSLSLGLVWRPAPGWEAGLWGDNLTQRRHPEFGSLITPEFREVPRSFSLRLTWTR